MRRFLSLFPFLSAGTVQAALALAIALGAHLTAAQTGTVEAAAAAVLALITAPAVHPFPVPLFMGALTAIGALAVAFRVPHITSGEVSAAVAFLAALLASAGHLAVETKAGMRERAAKRQRAAETRM